MRVTITVEPQRRQAKVLSFGGFFSSRTFEMEPERTVYCVIATVVFDATERDSISRSGIRDHVVWRGPVEKRYDERDIEWNLRLRPFVTYKEMTGRMVRSVGFAPLVDPSDRDQVRPPRDYQDVVQVNDLTPGRPHIVRACETLAEANVVETEFREALVKLKQAIVIHDRPANRTDTFEL